MADPPSDPDDLGQALISPPDGFKSRTASSVALQAIDRLIADAPIDRLPDLIRARGEIIRQDRIVQEDERDRAVLLSDLQEMRARERLSFWARMAFSAATLGAGTALTVAGFDVVGCFLVGGSMAVFVPGYVKAYLTGGKSGGDDAKPN